MKTITFAIRTTKSSGTIRLRFRLRDGRDVQLFHKSDIEADLRDLDKFGLDCQVKSRTRVYNTILEGEINAELILMEKAYDKMVEQGLDRTSEVFEKTINELRIPVEQERAASESLTARFRRFAEESYRDRIIGKPRYNHYLVLAGKLERYVTIKGISRIVPSEVTPDFLMDFRNFIFNEVDFVKQYPLLYKKLDRRHSPSVRLSLNTVAEHMKLIRAFFTLLEDNDEIAKSPYRRLGRERRSAVVKVLYDDPVFLRAEEFKIVRTAKLPEALSKVRDAFVLQCALGCRISDFSALSMENVSVSEEGIPFIHYLPLKTRESSDTNAEVKTPLVRFAFDIVVASKLVFPILRNVSGKAGYNVKIKDVLQFCGIDRKVAVYNEEKRENEYVPLYTQGSSKLCRKTNVDMLNKIQIDKSVAGLHKKGSKAVDRYTNLELRDRFALMNRAFEQKAFRVDQELNVVRK